MKIIAMLVVLATIQACAQTTISEAGKKVKLTKNEPINCEELSDLEVTGGSSIIAKVRLRNAAAEAGGNVVVFDSIMKEIDDRGVVFYTTYSVTGRAFKCKK